MNKKAYEFFEVPMWILRMIYAIIIMLTVIFIVNFFIVTEVNAQRIDTYVTEGLLYYSASPGGLAYYDSSLGRTVPGLIDSRYFQDPKIEQGNKNIIGAQVTLVDKTVVLNKDIFDRLNWLALGGLTADKGGPDKVTYVALVNFRNSSGTRTENMKVEVVTADT